MAVNENILVGVMELHDSVSRIKVSLEKEYASLVKLYESKSFEELFAGFKRVVPYSLLYLWENRLDFFRTFFAESRYLYDQFGELLRIVRVIKNCFKDVSDYGAAKPAKYAKMEIVLVSPKTFNELDSKFALVEDLIDSLPR